MWRCSCQTQLSRKLKLYIQKEITEYISCSLLVLESIPVDFRRAFCLAMAGVARASIHALSRYDASDSLHMCNVKWNEKTFEASYLVLVWRPCNKLLCWGILIRWILFTVFTCWMVYGDFPGWLRSSFLWKLAFLGDWFTALLGKIWSNRFFSSLTGSSSNSLRSLLFLG